MKAMRDAAPLACLFFLVAAVWVSFRGLRTSDAIKT